MTTVYCGATGIHAVVEVSKIVVVCYCDRNSQADNPFTQ